MVIAGTRVPRTQGIPPMMSGLDQHFRRQKGLGLWSRAIDASMSDKEVGPQCFRPSRVRPAFYSAKPPSARWICPVV